jgi:radical SAM protein with 4Fe4S-binding SPASM domain
VSCLEIPMLSYEEFDARIKNNAADKRVPLSVTLETTYRCNVSCIHCYADGSAGEQELSTQETIRILDEAADLGTMFLLMSGGDPLVRADFLEVYEHAKRLGMIITLFTNGTLVTEEIADALADYPPFAIEITVHSMRPEAFDAISGVPGSFKRCMDGIARLSERGLTLRLKSMAMRQNAMWLSEVEEYALSIGAPYRFDSVIIPGLDSSRQSLETRLAPESIVALDMASSKRVEALQELAAMRPPARSSLVYNCGGGRRGFNVNPYGLMSICPFTQHASYDLRGGSVAEGWSGFIPAVLARSPRTPNPCPTCDLLWLCNRCAGKSYLETGDEEAPIPFWCDVAKLRRQALTSLSSGGTATPCRREASG